MKHSLKHFNIKMIDHFYEHIAHKLTNFLPIKQKVILFMNEELKDDNIKFLKNESYEKLITFFYNNRNDLVHNGKFPKIKGLDLNWKQAFFSMLIERLIAKVLGMQHLVFDQFGDHEYIFMKLNEKIENNYGDYFNSITTYLYSNILLPLINKNNLYSENGSIDKDKLYYIFYEKNLEYKPLIVKLKKFNLRAKEILSDVIRMELRYEGVSEIFFIKIKEISAKRLMIKSLDEDKNCFLLTKAWIEEKEIKCKSIDNPAFTIIFSGYIEDIPDNNQLYVRIIPSQLEIIKHN